MARAAKKAMEERPGIPTQEDLQQATGQEGVAERHDEQHAGRGRKQDAEGRRSPVLHQLAEHSEAEPLEQTIAGWQICRAVPPTPGRPRRERSEQNCRGPQKRDDAFLACGDR